MNAKKVSFGARPGGAQPATLDANNWVASRNAESTVKAPAAKVEPIKRLIVDVPANLHAKVKASCAMRGMKISDEVRAWLEQEFNRSWNVSFSISSMRANSRRGERMSDKITKTASAVDKIQAEVGEALCGLQDAFNGRIVNGYGVYTDPALQRRELQEARDHLDAALKIMAATTWPTSRDYDAFDATSANEEM